MHKPLLNELQQDQEEQTWTFEKILDHRMVKKDKYEVLILWTTGEETWEPLEWIAPQDPVSFAQYGDKQNLLNKPG